MHLLPLAGILVACQSIAPQTILQPTALPQPTFTASPQPSSPTIMPSPTLLPVTPTHPPTPIWVAGDFHHHSFLTDGSQTEADIAHQAFTKFGLDWLIDSEHGGSFLRSPLGLHWDDPSLAGKVSLLGNPVFANDKKVKHQAMWRWQSLLDFSWPLLFGGKDGAGTYQPGLQLQYPQKLILQGLEWDVPGHDHASVAILNQPDAIALSNFEYQFDASDHDTSRSDLPKQNNSPSDALAGITFLETNFPQSSYAVINHPSRMMDYTAADIRDMINAGPHIMLGIEGIPGHQKSPVRGDYANDFLQNAGTKSLDVEKTALARTYGGADILLAQLGGLMDSLWGEGRHFWVFANSDFHNPADNADFYPGEYAKTYFNIPQLTQTGILTGMTSGNLFIVQGDLINALDFNAASGGSPATMGQTLQAASGTDITITIRLKSPALNNNAEKPIVDHIDLIAGDVTGVIPPQSAAYSSNSNPSTRIIARFTSQNWHADPDGFTSIVFTLPHPDKNIYLRLRGTNLGPDVENQTQAGNPLSDDKIGPNDKTQAYADLWFYSNPIFITIK